MCHVLTSAAPPDELMLARYLVGGANVIVECLTRLLGQFEANRKAELGCCTDGRLDINGPIREAKVYLVNIASRKGLTDRTLHSACAQHAA